MRRAFTLVELLVVVAIIGVMTTIGMLSLIPGQGAARIKGATRDIFAAIRHARSTALVTQQPVIITYSTEEVDGVISAKIETTSAKLFGEQVERSRIRTVLGDSLPEEETEAPIVETGDDKGETADNAEGAGQTIGEILFAPIDSSVVDGIRIKVAVDGEETEGTKGGVQRKSRISVFSNVDYLIGRYNDYEKDKAAKKAKSEAAGTTVGGEDSAVKKEELQKPVKIVWEANGRVTPHQVWVYADGETPEDGLSIKIDRFGAAKVLGGSERDD